MASKKEEPEIVDVHELKLVGPSVVFKGEDWDEDNVEAQKLWGEAGYFQKVASLESRTDRSKCYGVIARNSPDQLSAIYMAAVQVADFDEIPLGTFAIVLPASTYARFTLHGPVKGIGKLKSYVRKIWFPSSGYKLAHPYWYEVYGEQFRGGVEPTSELELYFPIV